MADGMIQDLPSGAGRVLARQFLQVQGGHVGLKSDLRAAPRQRLRFSTSVFCLLFSACCCAEELTDPTRPPVSVLAPVVTSGAEVVPTPAGLQSIIISKTRRAAIIGGETVELGGKHGDAKLIEVNEGSVVLRGAQGRQVLTLFPDVKITGKPEARMKLQPPVGEAQSGKRSGKPVAREEIR